MRAKGKPGICRFTIYVVYTPKKVANSHDQWVCPPEPMDFFSIGAMAYL